MGGNNSAWAHPSRPEQDAQDSGRHEARCGEISGRIAIAVLSAIHARGTALDRGCFEHFNHALPGFAMFHPFFGVVDRGSAPPRPGTMAAVLPLSQGYVLDRDYHWCARLMVEQFGPRAVGRAERRALEMLAVGNRSERNLVDGRGCHSPDPIELAGCLTARTPTMEPRLIRRHCTEHGKLFAARRKKHRRDVGSHRSPTSHH